MAKITVPIVIDWDNIKKMLDEHDIVEVVRCRDCKYCLNGDPHELWCNGHGSPARLTTNEDFCSHGERGE